MTGPDTSQHHLGSPDPIRTATDGLALVDLAGVVTLAFAGISAAVEVFGQYQSWRQSRESVRSQRDRADERTLATMRTVLLQIDSLYDIADGAMRQVRESIEEAWSLIEPENHALVNEIPFLAAYKGRLRRKDRARYRQLVKECHRDLSELLRALDESAELVSYLIPPESDTDMLRAARLAAAESGAISDVLVALSSQDTMFGEAVELVIAVLDASGQYIGMLREEAWGDFGNPPR